MPMDFPLDEVYDGFTETAQLLAADAEDDKKSVFSSAGSHCFDCVTVFCTGYMGACEGKRESGDFQSGLYFVSICADYYCNRRSRDCKENPDILLAEMETPEAGDRDIVVRNIYASICGTVGGFSEYVLIPDAQWDKQIYRVSDKISSKEASLIEPFTVGCRAARRSAPKQGEKAIGIAADIALKYFGCVQENGRWLCKSESK